MLVYIKEEIMKGFRNFLYNNSDILVAIGFLAATIAIIAWGMEVLMSYGG